MPTYTCKDAATFDPQMRRFVTAQALFIGALSVLPAGLQFHDVEFDTECTNDGQHSEHCRIDSVTIRPLSVNGSTGPVYSIPFATLPEGQRDAVTFAHRRAYFL